MSLEKGKASLYVGATRPNLILGIDPRAFWMIAALATICIMIHNFRVNLFGVVLSVLLYFIFHALGQFAPYAIDEIQRFHILPAWGRAEASVQSPRRYTPYPPRKAAKAVQKHT
jgi:type IV secretory pathway VirB3-like protein